MALQKQSINVNFAKGLDLKTEKNQVAMDRFLVLENAVFKSGAGLQKRNGFGNLTTLPTTTGTNLATLNDNLLATGSVLQAFSANTNSWMTQGITQPVSLATRAAVRNSTSQSGADTAISSQGLECAVWAEGSNSFYQVADNTTGQMIVNRTQLEATATNPRVNVVGTYFIITYTATISASPHLRYVAVPINTPTAPHAAADISTQVKSVGTGYDAITVNNSLYIAWNGSDIGGAVRVAYLSSTLLVSSAKVYATFNADLVAITVDLSLSSPIIWFSFWDSGSTNGWAGACTGQLVTVLAPTQIITTEVISHLTMLAKNGTATILYDVQNLYSFSAVRSDFINNVSISQAGSVSSVSIVARSVALASKAFYDSNGTAYVLVVYGGAFQPTYFLVDFTGNVVLKLAYENAGGYVAAQVLSNVCAVNDSFYFAYQFKDLLVSVNKTQGLASAGGIYTQTGINIATIKINASPQYSSEIALSLHLTGGFVWQYDAVKPVEHGFHLWPEDLTVTTITTGGAITDQQYYYVFCYEWTDSQGMLHRSAPSIPITVTTAGGNTSTNTINVPTLRLTYKVTPNPVRLVGYRWSVGQQNYYQFTSITSPVLNDPTTDSIAVVDTLADSAILGNTLLYTTGNVLENIAAPAASHSTLSQNRMWVIDAEDRNLVWYSKLVIEATPVEFSDLQTIYIAPTTGAQGSSGPLYCLASMDDKTIYFKENAIYYTIGKGPDITGANNDFSEPTYITSAAGSSNPASLVLTPMGLMFQSNKGIWMLGRDLSTKYIGADVEAYNNDTVVSALAIPGTNEVRFTLASGAVLMYDYYYSQWGTFTNIPAISSTLYQGQHTYLNSLGQVRQETPKVYIDGTSPVLMKFSTAWLKLTGLQGYQRSYALYLLSQYLSPYKLNVQIGYDYQPGIAQQTVLTPNISPSTYGSDTLYGGGAVFGSTTGIDQRRVFLDKQRCQSMQITVTEIFDSSKGVAAGAGFAMSGINVIIGAKSNKPTISAEDSAS